MEFSLSRRVVVTPGMATGSAVLRLTPTTPQQRKFPGWAAWSKGCQPEFLEEREPNPYQSCGLCHACVRYGKPRKMVLSNRIIDRFHHDTIGMVVIDDSGEVSAGTSTNGAWYKVGFPCSPFCHFYNVVSTRNE
ncbi:unnamed protein product, partial [Mesorhabditis spiculigera]